MASILHLLNNSYNIIIIGAGTAGCVLANRLSEDSNLRILLIEAGSDHTDDDAIRIPGFFTKLPGNDLYDWKFASEPEQGLNGRTIRQPRGKVVGGSSVINSHALIYPSRSFFDAWNNFGNPNWNWEMIQPYFRKFQTVDPPSEDIKESLHLVTDSSKDIPRTGLIHASYPMKSSALREAWVAAHEELEAPLTGIGYAGDCHGGGTTMAAVNQETRERSHAGAYYEQARTRPNLFLASLTLVERIVFDATHGQPRATGVQVVHDNRRYIVSCSQEVILCAGAFQSPQLLELSGIGNSARLQALGIDVIYDNPRVGEGLQDHLNCGIAIETYDIDGIKLSAEQQRADYDTSKTGPLAEAAAYSFAYQSLFPSLEHQVIEDLKALLDSYSPCTRKSSYPSESIEYAYTRSIIEHPIEASAITFMVPTRRLPPNIDPLLHKDPRKYFSIIAMLAHPLSRGYVHIKSASAADHPEIKFNYLSHPLDAKILAYHLLAFDRLLDTSAFRDLTKPGGRRFTAGDTIDEAIAYIRAMARTNYHPCCTCAMMSEELGGVVSQRFKVYGVESLRVVDASVFPLITRGNVLTTVYAVAERAGDIIKDDLKTGLVGSAVPS